MSKSIKKDTGFSKTKNQSEYIRGNNYLLAIAIDEYSSYRKLNNCLKDVSDIVEELVAHYDFEEEDIKIISNGDATQRNILRALDNLYGKIGTNDSFILWYSGHGENLAGRNIGFMIPVDANDEYDFIDLSVIKNRLDTFRSKHIFVIFDSCFSGLILTQRDARRSHNIPENFPSRFALTSGRNSPVSDGTKAGNSPFAEALLMTLRDNKDKLGAVALSQSVLDYFRTSGTDREQLPDFGVINPKPEYRGQYYFYPKNYEETLDAQRKEILELKQALEVIERQKEELSLALRRSKSQTLAAKALLVKDQDPTLALRLSTTGYEFFATKETAEVIDSIIGYPYHSFYKKNIQFKYLDTDIPEDKYGFTNAVISPDNKYVLTQLLFRDVKLWNLDGDCVAIFAHDASQMDFIGTFAFSDDGASIITGSREQLKIWNLQGNCIHVLKDQNAGLKTLAITPDLKFVYLADENMTVKTWNINGSFNYLQTTKAQYEKPSIIEFSRDYNSVLFGLENGDIEIMRLDGQHLITLKGHKSAISTLAFSHDHKFILSGSHDATARLWDSTGNFLEVFTGHEYPISAATFSTDNRYITTGSGNGVVKLWDLKGNCLQTFVGHTAQIKSISFSPDSKSILTISSDNSLKTWNIGNCLLNTLVAHSNRVFEITFSPNGKYILTGGDDGNAKLWDLEGNCLQTMPSERIHMREDTTVDVLMLKSVHFSPDGNTIYTIDWDGTTKYWNYYGNCFRKNDGNAEVFKFNWETKPIYSVRVTGQYVVAEGDYAELRTLEGEPLYRLIGHQDTINAVAFRNDGQYILTGSADKTARLWDLLGNCIRIFEGHQDEIIALDFVSDGNSILTESLDNIFKLWDLEGACLQTFNENNLQEIERERKVAPSVSTDVFYAHTAGNSAVLRTVDGTRLQIFEGHLASISTLNFSPNGKFILTGSVDKTVKLWNWEGICLQTFIDHGHEKQISAVALSYDEKYVLSGSADGVVKLWDLNGFCLQTIYAHRSGIKSVCFSPDGNIVAAGAVSGTVKLWKSFQAQILPENLALIQEEDKIELGLAQ